MWAGSEEVPEKRNTAAGKRVPSQTVRREVVALVTSGFDSHGTPQYRQKNVYILLTSSRASLSLASRGNGLPDEEAG